jgi:hypothetical protein
MGVLKFVIAKKMLTGIMFGFVIKNPYYSLLNFKDIITDTRIAPKYYSIRLNRMEVRETRGFKSFLRHEQFNCPNGITGLI